MTPNLTSARRAIQAELLHARQGVDYYTSCVEALETALETLDSVEPSAVAREERSGRKRGAAPRKRAARTDKGESKASRKDGSAGAEGAAKRRRPRRADGGRASANLPETGKQFWYELISDQPQSAAEIAGAAAEKLGIAADQQDKVKKLKQRVAPALATLVSEQKINDSGAGRGRRYFRQVQA